MEAFCSYKNLKKSKCNNKQPNSTNHQSCSSYTHAADIKWSHHQIDDHI